MKSRNGIKILHNGKILLCVTITQLGLICKRTKSNMHRLEEREIIRRPNIYLEGNRLYTMKLALKIGEILSEVRQGVKITSEQRRQIALAFQEEQLDLHLKDGMTEQQALNKGKLLLHRKRKSVNKSNLVRKL